MKYERLTKRISNNEVIHNCGKCPKVNVANYCSEANCATVILDRLAELEDKIESGELDFSCNVPKDETDCVLLQAKYDIALRKYAKLRRIVTRYNVMTKTVDNEITEEAEARIKELQGE